MLPKVEAGRETSVAPRDAEDSEVTKDPGEGSSMGGEATEHGQWRLGLDKKKKEEVQALRTQAVGTKNNNKNWYKSLRREN